MQLPQLKSETAHHESCQEWFLFVVGDIQLSATSRAASLLLASLSMALGRWLARGKHEAGALSAVSYTLSIVLSASAACEVQAQISASFFSILCLRCHFSTLGGLPGFVKGREACAMEQLEGATAASSHCFSSCLVPSMASCAEISNSPAAAVLGSSKCSCTQLAAQGAEEAAALGLEQSFLLHLFFCREEWLGLAFIGPSALVILS